MIRFRLIAFAALAGAVTAACSSDNLPPIKSGIGFAVTMAASADTIDAVSRANLVIVVYDSTGKGIPGVRVDFTTDNMFVPGDDILTGDWTVERTLQADASGKLQFLYRLGDHAGIGHLFATTRDAATGVTYADTIAFPIPPGQPVGGQHRVIPADTTLFPGDSFAIVAGGVDRNGNFVPMTATFAANGGIGVTSGGIVTANAFGRYFVTATTGAGSDTVWVTVVPGGDILAGKGDSVFVVRLDGSVRPLPFAEIAVASRVADWAPDGQHFVVANDGNGLALRRVDLQGNIVLVGPDSLGHLDAPRFSADGRYLFFHGTGSELRSDPDGTHPIRALPFDVDEPDESVPSPDGQLVTGTIRDTVRAFGVPGGVAQPWAYYGGVPHWSPDGKWIAMFASDPGINIGVLVDPGNGVIQHDLGKFSPRLWSPDSQWLIVDNLNDGSLWIYRLSDGSMLALPLNLSQYTLWSWKAAGG